MSKYGKLLLNLLGIIVLAFSLHKDYKNHYSKTLPYLQERKTIGVNQSKDPEMKQNKQNEGNPSTMLAPLNSDERKEITKDQQGIFKQEELEKVKQGLSSKEAKSTEDKKNEIRLAAVSAALLDGDSNRVLYEKNGYNEVAMASTTKIMTCIIALEQGNLDDVVTASKNAAKMPDVQLNMITGEQFYLRDLLYSLMLESHNDTAVAIAEHIGGSVEGFAELMNAKAKELGCEHTNFVTPNGLDADGHYTTAVELGKIAAYAIKNEKFIAITNAANHQFKEIKTGKTYSVVNKNRFLYMMDGAIGVKTGFTNNAGYCFVGAVKRDNRTFISVVLGSGWPPHKTYKWKDTTSLMNYGLSNYTKKQQIDKKVAFPEIEVEKGKTRYIGINADIKLDILLRNDESLTMKLAVPESLRAPVMQGEQIGVLNVYINDDKLTAIPVYTTEGVEKTGFKYFLKKIVEGYFD